VGITGAAHSFLLVGGLEGASSGDRIVCASYGDGSDAFLVKVIDRIAEVKGIPKRDGLCILK